MVDYNNFDDMAAALGQDTGPVGDYSRLPIIKVNADVIDGPDGEPIIMPGWFYVDLDGTKVYGKTVYFRPYVNAYQYSKFNASNPKDSVNSIIIKNFKEEAIDEAGGTRCGKLTAVEMSNIPEGDRAAANNGATVYRLVYGTVSFSGITTDGTKKDIKDVSAHFKLRGVNFMPFGDVIKALTKNRKLMYNHVFTVSSIKKKNGGITFYELAFTTDMNQSVPFANSDATILGEFEELIDSTNKRIVVKHRQQQNAKATNTARKNARSFDLDAELNDPLDNIP